MRINPLLSVFELATGMRLAGRRATQRSRQQQHRDGGLQGNTWEDASSVRRALVGVSFAGTPGAGNPVAIAALSHSKAPREQQHGKREHRQVQAAAESGSLAPVARPDRDDADQQHGGFLSASTLSLGITGCSRDESRDETRADVAKAQTEGRENVAEVRRNATEDTAEANREVALAKAEADHKVSIELCEAMAGDARSNCKDDADNTLEVAQARAEADKLAADPTN